MLQFPNTSFNFRCQSIDQRKPAIVSSRGAGSRHLQLSELHLSYGHTTQGIQTSYYLLLGIAL